MTNRSILHKSWVRFVSPVRVFMKSTLSIMFLLLLVIFKINEKNWFHSEMSSDFNFDQRGLDYELMMETFGYELRICQWSSPTMSLLKRPTALIKGSFIRIFKPSLPTELTPFLWPLISLLGKRKLDFDQSNCLWSRGFGKSTNELVQLNMLNNACMVIIWFIC